MTERIRLGRKAVKKARRLVAPLSLVLLAGLLGAPVTATEDLAVPGLTAEDVLGIAATSAPPEGTALKVHADFPAEHPLVVDGIAVYALTADLSSEGDVTVTHAVTGDSATGIAGADECTDPAFVPLGVVWAEDDMPVEWRLNVRRVPARISQLAGCSG